MIKTLLSTLVCSKLFWMLIGFNLGISFQILAQKKTDYIVVDSVLTYGNIKSAPIHPDTELEFKRTKKGGYNTYDISTVKEFRVSDLFYLRKEIQLNGQRQSVFLELLNDSVSNASLWKLNAKELHFFLETPEGITPLNKENYKAILAENYDDPIVQDLIGITPLWELPLEYLSKTINTITKPRTFTKVLVFTPFIGVSNMQTQFLIPFTNVIGKISFLSPVVGMNGEYFVSFKRNISINLGANFSQFDGQAYQEYRISNQTSKSDLYLDYNLIQFPIRGKYYLDFEPNRLRGFASFGYSFAILSLEKGGMFIAEFQEAQILTYQRPLAIDSKYSGINTSLGLERYLSKHRGLVLELSYFQLQQETKDQISGINLHLGYKF